MHITNAELRQRFDQTFPSERFGRGNIRYLNLATGGLVILIAILDLLTFGALQLALFSVVYLAALVVIAGLMIFSDAEHRIVREYFAFIENWIGRGVFNLAAGALIVQFPSPNSLVSTIEVITGAVLLGVGAFYIIYGYTKQKGTGYNMHQDEYRQDQVGGVRAGVPVEVIEVVEVRNV